MNLRPGATSSQDTTYRYRDLPRQRASRNTEVATGGRPQHLDTCRYRHWMREAGHSMQIKASAHPKMLACNSPPSYSGQQPRHPSGHTSVRKRSGLRFEGPSRRFTQSNAQYWTALHRIWELYPRVLCPRVRKAHANAPVSDVSCCWPGLYVLCDGRRRASGLPYATSWDSADDTRISVVPHSDW